MKAVLVMDSPLGVLQLIAEADGLTALSFLDDASASTAIAAATDTPLLQRARAQLQAYFSGDAIVFDLPLRPQGTPFQQAVWRALQTVPYGQTISYALLAQRLGLPAGHARAVGAAVGRNPLLIIVPCHRIVGHDGRLTGYAAGLPRKQALLDLERAAPISTRTPTQTPTPRRPRVA
ncbi:MULTISPECIES: methylated-DNA--[protein]-cysteine S-methyltransferase [unclassified Thiomonas]|uniref:methylated-DNA--[protein]-cysteine S-methyltransferase n=1 Tax=unclassified Thiomonas TaxID=2625466 RepID=UPI0004DBA382|nr:MULTISPECIES: methylated-DNA--[protein]-cysteine S-methyltransferase [unclassified Thiomonas]CDW95005.1 Methylated-DNA--protein-cysteine methyltransferase [Thiomonas sp. CB2]VDY06038.1 Methylated-DNA--protein-cysteine methyltransferase [Thiomonas sp. Bio17B3]VDY10665.1 Methylated-DNA--protein-cysteine methyltransferase [Thiomonas sp. Sup16B3]VDY14300.1 Methylated-DNA--protein-cysteine methyltransferase (6-O- methylguanine-DNA methyltransferase) (MGMT) (O-6-methylguanine-DNA-alkyltransferase)